MVYGRHPVREAARGRRRIERLYLTQSALQDLEEVVRVLRSKGVPVEVVQKSLELSHLAGTGDHQGIVAEVSAFKYVSTDDLLAHAESREVAPFIIALDQITDPHNLGAIARVADASGATGLLIPEHRSAKVTAAAVKVSAGALEHVLVAQCKNLAREIERTKGPQLWAYAATEHASSSFADVDFTDGVLLVLGAEGAGIRPRVEAACDLGLRIPMSGEVASLNVSTVSAIVAFEALRQRDIARSRT